MQTKLSPLALQLARSELIAAVNAIVSKYCHQCLWISNHK